MFEEKKVSEIMSARPDISREMAELIYVSRLIGGKPGWVLHGGGNTSLKQNVSDLFEENREAIFVKGSGRDMAGIEADDFTALNLSPLRRLRQLARISDEEMDNQLKINKLRADSPDPSVEALLHVFLPHKFIIHTHADPVLALTNRSNAAALIKKILGPAVCIIPYEKSGLPLALSALSAWEKNPEAKTIVVLHHGIFTFSEDAKTAYQRMANCIKKAEAWLEKQKPAVSTWSNVVRDDGLPARIAQIIRGACADRDNPDHIHTLLVDIRDRADIIEVSLSKKGRKICETGVLTPDHAIRTKNRYVYIDHIPATDEELADLITRQVDKFKKAYKTYFKSFQTDSTQTMLDPAPRVFLVAGVGLFALGETAKAARIAADIAEHSILTKYRTGLESFAPIDEAHVFDMEYWPLQQKKLRSFSPALLEGRIALVTGAAGAIGFGIADRLLAAGAAVVVSDIDETGLETVREILARRYYDGRVADVCFDVTDEQSVKEGIETASLAFGGIDILVPNAGTAHVANIENLDSDILQMVISVNLMGTFKVIKSTIPVFRRQKTGGNIVVISTKNVFDPGASFGAYSASKAGAHQIAKIAALELAELGVRVNMVNPDAVFGDKTVPSKLWEMIGPDRMKARGLDPDGLKEYYRQRNLLKVPVSAQHVGNAVVFFAAELTPTTGASLPVDGGVPAAFPR